jgi:hypothetical protein
LGINGRPRFGSFAERASRDFVREILRGIFFEGIATLKRRPEGFVKKGCRQGTLRQPAQI